MSAYGKWEQRSQLFNDVSAVETHLDAVLNPVAPRPEFVSELKSQLTAGEASEHRLRKTLPYVILGGAGVISVLMFLIGGVRAVANLVGTMQVARSLKIKNQLGQDQMSPVTPAV